MCASPRSVHEGTVSLLSARNRLVATLEQLPRSGLSHLIHIAGYAVYQACDSVANP